MHICNMCHFLHVSERPYAHVCKRPCALKWGRKRPCALVWGDTRTLLCPSVFVCANAHVLLSIFSYVGAYAHM